MTNRQLFWGFNAAELLLRPCIWSLGVDDCVEVDDALSARLTFPGKEVKESLHKPLRQQDIFIDSGKPSPNREEFHLVN